MSRRLTALFFAVALCLTLFGCGSAGQAYTDYVQAVMDCSYHGDTTQYMAFTGCNETDAQQVHTDEMLAEKIRASVLSVLENEEFDLYERVSESLALAASEDETSPDAETLHTMYLDAKKGKAELPEWYLPAFGTAFISQLDHTMKLHPLQPETQYDWMFEPNGMLDILAVYKTEEPKTLIASQIEGICYQESYTQIIRLCLFLTIELVTLIICCIIASMTRDLEETMHLRRGDHLLAVPVALVEAATMLFILCVTVRLIVQLTDDQMIFFNRSTIDGTLIFKHLYNVQGLLFGSR